MPRNSGWYGADYNPEQWPEDVLREDIRIMQAPGMNAATVGVFSWAKLQPGPDRFDFAWLDRVVEGLAGAGVEVTQRRQDGIPRTWVLNHNDTPVTVHLPDPARDILRGGNAESELHLDGKQTALLIASETSRRLP